MQLASILGKKIELEIKNRIEEANTKTAQGEKAKTEKHVGPRNITDEVYGGSMLQKRNKWEG